MQYPWSGKTPMHVCNGIDRITWLWLDSRTLYVFYLHIFFSKKSFFYTGWSIYCFHIFRLKNVPFQQKGYGDILTGFSTIISCKVCTFACFYLIKSSLDKFQNWLNFLWNSEITKTLYQYIIWYSIVMLPHHRLGHNSSECIENQMRLQNKDTHFCIPRVKSVLKIKKTQNILSMSDILPRNDNRYFQRFRRVPRPKKAYKIQS